MAEPGEGKAGNGAGAPSDQADGNRQPGNAESTLINAFAGAEGAEPLNNPAGDKAGGDGKPEGGEGVKLAPWAEQLPPELKGEAKFAKFAKVGDLAKAYLELEGKRQGSGKPESPEGYSFAKEEGAGVFAKIAHAGDLSEDQAVKVYKELADFGKAQTEAQAKAREDAIVRQALETEETLKKEYGGHFAEKMELLTRGLSAAGAGVKEALKAAGLQGNIDIARAFINFGQMTAESGSARGSGTPHEVRSILNGGSFEFKQT
ncbi:MAG: hypothetical protein LBF78_15940 [Treponema sp.]|nr:hypothetical protein [Treponema sp.]